VKIREIVGIILIILAIIGIFLGLCVGTEAEKYENYHYFGTPNEGYLLPEDADYDIVLMALFSWYCLLFGGIFLFIGICLIASCKK
jgi:hypothetical protein